MQNRPSLDQIFGAQEQARPSLAQIFNDKTEKKNFYSQTADDLRKRGANLANSVAGEDSIPETAYQFALGNVVGGASDVASNAINYAPMPQLGGLSPKQLTETAMMIPGFSRGLEPIAKGAEFMDRNYEAYDRMNPRAGRNFAATRELANVVPFGNRGVRTDIRTGIKALKEAGKETIPSSQNIKDIARESYRIANEKQGIINPEAANSFFKDIEISHIPDLHGSATSGETAVNKLIERWKVLKDKPISLESAQNMDKRLSALIEKEIIPTTGELNAEGRELFEVQSKLRDLIENSPVESYVGGKEGFEAAKEGRAFWATANRIGDMERIIERAKMMEDPVSAIKAGFRNLYNNPTRMRGFNDQEKAVIKKAAESGVISDTLRHVFGNHVISLIGGSVGGGLTGAVASIPASIASRGIANKMQISRANKAIKQTAKRIPSAKEIGKLPPKEAIRILEEGERM